MGTIIKIKSYQVYYGFKVKHPKIDLKTTLGTAPPVCTMHRARKAGNIRFRPFFIYRISFSSVVIVRIVLNFSVFLKVIELFLPNKVVIYSENGSFFCFSTRINWYEIIQFEKKKQKQKTNKNKTKSIKIKKN